MQSGSFFLKFNAKDGLELQTIINGADLSDFVNV